MNLRSIRLKALARKLNQNSWSARGVSAYRRIGVSAYRRIGVWRIGVVGEGRAKQIRRKQDL